jgi:CRISPR system Cascade subunit CasD
MNTPKPAYLVLYLDAPFQAWGLVNSFSNRGTAPYPTKGSIIGMICAAMGLPKASPPEQEWLPKLSRLILTTLTLSLGGQRLDDFHTVLGTRRAKGDLTPYAVITRRQYLQDARFGAILAGDTEVLAKVEKALQDPVWGIWFGRKCCIPASPVCGGIVRTLAAAWTKLKQIAGIPIDERIGNYLRVEEVADFPQGTDTLPDQPLSFGLPNIKDPRDRKHTLRRVKLVQPLNRPTIV